MAINPMQIMKIKSQIGNFRKRHPGFASFIRAVRKKGLPENSVIEVKITPPEGDPITTNFRVTAEDLEVLGMVSDLAK